MFSRKFSSNIRRKQRMVVSTIILLVLFLSIGYAFIGSDLSINGTLNVSKYIPNASELSYDKTNTNINCNTAQCTLDYIDGLLD